MIFKKFFKILKEMQIQYEDNDFKYVLFSGFNHFFNCPIEYTESCDIESYDVRCSLFRKSKGNSLIRKENFEEKEIKNKIEFNYIDGFSPFVSKFTIDRNSIVKDFAMNFKQSKNMVRKIKILFQALSLFDSFIFLSNHDLVLTRHHFFACFGIANKMINFELPEAFNTLSNNTIKSIKLLELEIMKTIRFDTTFTSVVSFLKPIDFYKENMLKYLEILFTNYKFNHFSYKTQANACLYLTNNDFEIDSDTQKCALIIDTFFKNGTPSFSGLTPKNERNNKIFEEEERAYKRKDYLSKGAYGSIFKVEDNIAIKVIPHDSNGMCPSAIKEILFLNKFDNPNIISIKNIKVNETNTSIYFDLFPFDLHSFSYKNNFSFNFWKKCFKKILEGVEYMHRMNVIHTDIKPGNILISVDENNKNENDIQIKIIDFGSSMYSFNGEADRNDIELTTSWYRAPELCMEHPVFSNKIDIWSTACSFVQILRKKPLFSKPCNVSILFNIFEQLGTPENTNIYFLKHKPDFVPKFDKKKVEIDFDFQNENNKNNFHDLLSKMLEIDPKKRCSALEALEHSLFNDLI